MKSTLTFIFSCISFGYAFAQVASQKGTTANTMLPRLVAQATVSTVLTGGCPDYFYLTSGDSMVYSYSGKRGGDLNHQLKYDIAIDYKYDTTGHKFLNTPNLGTKQTFDSRDNVVLNASGNNCKRYYTYDAENRLLSYTGFLNSNYANPTDTMWYGWENYQYAYDANGNQTMKMFQLGSSANSGVWGKEQKTICTYDKDNHLLYTVDQVGYYPTNQWLNAQQSSITYSNGYRSSIQELKKWDTLLGAWVNYGKLTNSKNLSSLDSYKHFQYWQTAINDYGCGGSDTVFSYDDEKRMKSISGTAYYGNMLTGCGSASTRMNLYMYDDIGRLVADSVHGGYETYSDFDGNLPRHILYMHHGNATNTYLTYNRYGQTTSFIYTSPDRTDTSRYYYDNSLLIADSIRIQDSINNILTGNFTDTSVNGHYNLHIFPVPANNHFTVDLRWDTARSYTLTVLTIDGRIVNKFEGAVGKHTVESYTTAELPAGNYLLRINYDKGVIVRRLVVVH